MNLCYPTAHVPILNRAENFGRTGGWGKCIGLGFRHVAMLAFCFRRGGPSRLVVPYARSVERRVVLWRPVVPKMTF